MSTLVLTQTGFENGVWSGQLSASAPLAVPELEVVHDGAAVDGLRLTATPGAKHVWDVVFDLPRAALSEGTQVFLITEKPTGEVLHRLTIIAGSPVTEDLRAEVYALRAELDQLRAAFRAEMRTRPPA